MSRAATIGSPDLRRDADALVADLLRRRPGYVPAWTAAPGDPGRAIVEVEAHLLASLWERLDQVPDKHKLAFLAELGVDSLPPAAARAPVAFEPMPLAGNSIIPEGSLVGAQGADGDQIVFRTEDAIGVTASPLAEVRSVVPGRDTVGDHTIEAMGERSFTLFANQTQTRRSLFIGHRSLLAIRGEALIAVEFELARDARVPLQLRWSIWDGTVWREFQNGFGSPDAVTDDTVNSADSFDEQASLSHSGIITLRSSGIESAPTVVDGIEAYWLRAELSTPLTVVEPLALPEIERIRLVVEIGSVDHPVTYPVATALALGQEADMSGALYPFGPAPDRTTSFYIDAADALATGSNQLTFVGYPEGGRTGTDPAIDVEFWDGAAWHPLATERLGVGDQTNADGTPVPFAVPIAVPSNWASSTVDGHDGTWLRMRLARNASYVGTEMIEVPVGPGETEPIAVPKQFPVRVSGLGFEVSGRSLPSSADHVLAFDGARYADHSQAARWRGQSFAPFRGRDDRTDTVYLGFAGPLPAANLGLYIEVEPHTAEGPPEHEFRWERFDGRRWVSLPVEDETAQLTATGIVRLLWPGNRVVRTVQPVVASDLTITTTGRADAHRFEPGELIHLREGETEDLAVIASIDDNVIELTKPLTGSYQSATMSEPEPALFGTARTWIRARLTDASPQPSITVRRLLANVAWASESRRIERLQLGTGNGQPNQRLFSTNTPLLPGVVIEVRELVGARARTDYAIIGREVADTAHTIDVEHDRDGDPTAVWVGWEVRPSFASSGPTDRHCVVDLVRGVVTFGNDVRGRTLPVGALVRLSADVGGGSRGNVGVAKIKNPLSGFVVASLANPVAASGGADAETAVRARRRAPEVIRHRYQAITVDDYRSLAIEASPEVLNATVVAVTDDLGGRFRIHVLPASTAPDPTPSAQLLERVERYITRRCPATAADLIDVIAPDFEPIGVAVTVAALDGQSELVYDRVRNALSAFLHPVTGGPDYGRDVESLATGWPFGATIHSARFGPIVERIDGVDHVDSITVTRGGTVVGDLIELDGGSLPLPGPFEIRLIRSETPS